MRLYLDGREIGSALSVNGVPQAGEAFPFMVGRRSGPGSHDGFRGQLDDVRVYSRALSPEEIEQIQ
jgi:hypothetical protein